MKRVSISGSPRENVGKKDAKKLRREGRVICVIYGGDEQKHFTVKKTAFDKLIFTPEVFIVDVELEGQVYPTIIQEVQYHPVTDLALHVDFLQLFEDKAVTVNIPVKFEGVAPGIIKGGVLNRKLRNIPVKGLFIDIPERISVDISTLDIGDTVKIRDIDFGKLTPQVGESNLIVSVKTARGAALDEDEEGEEGEEGEGEEGAEKKEAAAE